jgi:hypothetical protein
LLSNSRLISNPVILEAFSLPGEDDSPANPYNRDLEASGFGVADTVNAPVSEDTLAKAKRGPSQVKFA